MTSASSDCLPEYVRVLAVVVAELELRDIKQKVFAADLVESSNRAALNQGVSS